MEYLVGFFILLIFVIVVPAILVFGGFTDDPKKNRQTTNTYQDNEDDEEKKLDHNIGNLKQQNISYGGWIDYEDRRTYKDENDPTEFSEDW